nr:TPA_asm: m52.3 sORF 2 [Murid betaherpesvirus 1]DBA07997.1 TPA_asm: m52.3 sORF 2 [Murid betaherpesvirus 1]
MVTIRSLKMLSKAMSRKCSFIRCRNSVATISVAIAVRGAAAHLWHRKQ